MRNRVRMRVGGALVIVAAFMAVSAAARPQQPLPAEGRWRTIDDKTGQVSSIVAIVETNGQLEGKVEKVFSPPAKEADPVCQKWCPPDRRGKPIVGMTILWGLKRDGDGYTGGSVFDPDNGKTYKCKLKVIEGGRKLELRGFIGFSLIGRTQTWIRES
jgi:uncharacterized protein (DUF2147 family)